MDINEGQVAETMSMIRDDGGEASVFIGDVTKERDCQAAVHATTSRFGPLTTLVNNVAVTAKADVSQTSEEGWDHLLDTNLKSAMFMTKHSVPVMAQRGGAPSSTSRPSSRFAVTRINRHTLRRKEP